MTLDSISILNYKNIAEANLEFSSNLNCFTGKNGMGKTNIVDAIYYLSFGKSFFKQPDSLIVRYNTEMMMLKGEYNRRSTIENIIFGVQKGKRKSIKRNGKEYKRLSEHIGLLPVVMVSPLDWDLIRGGSEERRRFIDLIISQSNKEYLSNLIRYNKCLESRNSMMKHGIKDAIMYESIEAGMINAAQFIHSAREHWISEFSDIFHQYYHKISGDSEIVNLKYLSQLEEMPMEQILTNNRSKDLLIGYTTGGIHRDELELELNGYSMKKVGSQGQCKTYTIALRLAQYEFLKKNSGVTPLLLLDDIFDKLDSSRVENIISLVSGFGQIFITDTDRTHLDEIIIKSGSKDYKIFSVENGECNPTINSLQ